MMSEKVIYANGPILTMDPNCPFAEAVGVAGGFIAAVGALDDVRAAMGADARFIDLAGRTLLPGFIDGHSHFPSGGMNRLFGADLNVSSMRGVLDRLAEKARSPRPSEWIIGHSFDEQGMDEKRFPTRQELDSVTTEFPIFLRHVSGHSGAANSLALRLAGVTKDTPNPPGGIIGRDADGEPNGVLDGIPAQSLVRRIIPLFTMDEMRQAVEAESLVYAKAGITTAQGGPAFSPMDAELGHKVTKLMVQCAQDGTLPIRAVLFIRANRLENLAPYAGYAAGADLSGNGIITLGAAKLWADGDPRAHTGYFSAPYVASHGEATPYYGEYLYTPEELAELILPMHRQGWQVAIHANGDAGIETVVRAFEMVQSRAPRLGTRHLVIHAQYARRDQLKRMAMLGVYPCFFISPLWHWDHIHAAEVGDGRVNDFCPCADAEQLGLKFNLHTDSPITPVNPLTQIGVAVTRVSQRGVLRGRHQAISVLSALRSVTLNAAFLNFEESRKGSLTAGKYADMTILEQNPLTVAPEAIANIGVSQTIVGGKTVYEA